MREIIFRAGYRGTFVYGNLVCGLFNGVKFYEIEKSDNNDFSKWHVDEETIGQFTGLTDKNGKEIFEGDIWRKSTYPSVDIIVEFIKGKFNISEYSTKNGKVIGNIHNI